MQVHACLAMIILHIYLDEYLLKRSEIQGKVILDFGCGPGNDLVWYLERGVKKAIGIDVSKKSLEEAHQRLKLHGNNFELIHTYGTENFRIEDRSVDVITCYGVLHHIDDLTQILSEFKRILKPDGEIRIMVYNRDSVWYHLYVAHVLAYSTQIDSRLTDKIRRSLKKRISNNSRPKLDLDVLFRTSTDGATCPISRCYSPETFVSFMSENYFTGQFLGSAISLHELEQLRYLYSALSNEQLNSESAEFLQALTFNDKNIPVFGKRVAGINGHYKFKKIIQS